MHHLSSRPSRFLLLACLVSSLFFNVAFAHGPSEASDNIQTHLVDYKKEIAAMINTLDGIVADYASDEDVSEQVEALIGTWEAVEVHEAIETHATLLYPPVWAALGGLSQAVAKKGAQADVLRAQDRFEIALHEGMGALKLVAARKGRAGSEQAGHEPESGDRPTIAIIQDNLEKILELYRDGDTAEAKKLIHRTYMQRFEGIEGPLIEQDAELVETLELDFNATLPTLIENGAPAEKVSEQIEVMNTKLDRAQTLLEKAEQEQSSVF